MGFRGEALASIAAIAKVELTSRTQDSEIGYRIVVEGGQIISKEETGCPKGTTIIVENLFYNTPVRYKFLKKDFTELGYVEDTVTRLALVNPGIAIKLQSLGKTLIKTNGNENIKDTVYSIYGKDIAENIITVDYKFEDMKVSGCVGKPEIAKANRTGQLFFVNGRYIKDKTLTSAAEQAYKGLVPAGKYGFLVLNLDIDSHKIDVNVHPAKLEIRFQEENKIFKLVYHAIKETLANFKESSQEYKKEDDILELIKEGSNTKFDIKELERQRDYIYSNPVDNNESNDIPISNTGNLIEDIYNDRLRQHAVEDVSSEFIESEEIKNNEPEKEIVEDDGVNYFEDILKFQEELKKSDEIQQNSDKEDKTDTEVTENLIVKSIEEFENPIKDNLITIENPNDDEYSIEIPTEPVKMIEKSEDVKKLQEDDEDLNSSFEEMYRKTFGIKPVEKIETESIEENRNIKLEIAENIENRSMYDSVRYKFIGIVFSEYIIIQIDDELYIINQKAANERVIFEKLKKSYYANGNRESQMMLLPDVINLTSKQMDIARDNMLLLRKAGFEYEEFGDSTIKLVGVPEVCIDLETKDLFIEILDEINKVARTSKNEIEEKFIATIAASVAKNEKLAETFEEVDSLMQKLLIIDKPFTGMAENPIAIRLSQTDIKRKISK